MVGLVGVCVCPSVARYLVGTIQITVFAQSLSKFTCKLLMMRGGTLLILDRMVKGQGQLWPPATRCLALRCRCCHSEVIMKFKYTYTNL